MGGRLVSEPAGGSPRPEHRSVPGRWLATGMDAEQPVEQEMPPDTWRDKDDKRLAQLAELVRGSAVFSENLRESHGAVPAANSPARAATGKSFGGFALLAFDLATQKSVIVEDLLRGFAKLLEPPSDTPFAFQVLLRSILELTASTWRLADYEAAPRTVAGRAVTELITNARRNAALAANVKDEPSAEEAAQAREEQLAIASKLIDEAEETGLKIVRNNKKEFLGVEEIPPSATQLVSDAWEETYPESGGFLYGFFSGVPHGRSTAFAQQMKIHKAEDGRVHGRIFMSLQQMELWTQVAILGWGLANERVVHFAGWDIELLKQWQGHVASVTGRARIRTSSAPTE